MPVIEMPPRGHYLAYDVGRLAGVSGRTIGQWARYGYIQSSQSHDVPRVYSYQDVAEAMVVHELLEARVRHDSILKAIHWLRRQHGHSWPLTHADLFVPEVRADRRGRALVVSDDKGNIDVVAEHPVLSLTNLRAIAADLRRGGWAARELPDLQHIEVDPDRHSGHPVIAGTRIPAEDVARLAASRSGRRALKRDYGLHDAQVDDALAWWGEVNQYEAA